MCNFFIDSRESTMGRAGTAAPWTFLSPSAHKEASAAGGGRVVW